MKFNIPLEKKPEPKDGETRNVKRFAWYKRIGDTVIVLGYYNEVQKWLLPRVTSLYPRWVVTRRELLNDKLK